MAVQYKENKLDSSRIRKHMVLSKKKSPKALETTYPDKISRPALKYLIAFGSDCYSRDKNG